MQHVLWESRQQNLDASADKQTLQNELQMRISF